MPIETIEDLRAHVALATKVELTTIPPYLYAMYSIIDQESDAARLIASVVVEEMLHVSLTANLTLAIGGEPDFGYDVIPRYPCVLPHHTPELPVALERCSRELIRDTFMTIESPAAKGAPPEGDEFETLGQFYLALELAIDRLDDGSLFAFNQEERQLSDASFYSPVRFDAQDSGGLTLIDDRESADRALGIIIDQGEGLSDRKWADEGHQELTHFHKFRRLAHGKAPIGAVYPVVANPSSKSFPSHLVAAGDLFNALYGLTFVTMQALFSVTADQGAEIFRLYGLMKDCMAPTARYLVQQPIGDGVHAGPPFEVYRFSGDPWVEAATLAHEVAAAHPDLLGVATSVGHLSA